MQTQIQKEKFKGNKITAGKMHEILKSDLHNLSGLIYLMLKEETVLQAMSDALWQVHLRDEARKQAELNAPKND